MRLWINATLISGFDLLLWFRSFHWNTENKSDPLNLGCWIIFDVNKQTLSPDVLAKHVYISLIRLILAWSSPDPRLIHTWFLSDKSLSLSLLHHCHAGSLLELWVSRTEEGSNRWRGLSKLLFQPEEGRRGRQKFALRVYVYNLF